MKFTDETIDVLKNFSSINQSILFKNDNVIETIAPTRTVYAKVKLNHIIGGEFAIYDLQQFLGILSMFENPEYTLHDKKITIESGNTIVDYMYADPETITIPEEKMSGLKIKNPDVEFKLKKKDLIEVQKALGILGLPEFVIHGDGKNIMIQAKDSKNSSCNIFNIKVDKTDKKFDLILVAENMKLLPGDYDVKVDAGGLSQFIGDNIEYFIAVEAHSTID